MRFPVGYSLFAASYRRVAIRRFVIPISGAVRGCFARLAIPGNASSATDH